MNRNIKFTLNAKSPLIKKLCNNVQGGSLASNLYINLQLVTYKTPSATSWWFKIIPIRTPTM